MRGSPAACATSGAPARMSPLLLLLTLALVAAIAALARRRLRRSRLRADLATRPGGSFANPIPVRSFDEMDLHLGEWPCPCGARPQPAGEGSREIDGRRFRVARLHCETCEEDFFVYFDTTDLLQ